jgi:uncharacterized RDD family membrane protein YckC
VKLITEVLDKAPPSPDKVRPEIPAGLAKAVMRCLAKDRAKRFPSYSALRDALLPFSSTAPSPAVLGLRFVAGMVDEFVAYLPATLLLLWFGRDSVETLLGERTVAAAIFAIIFLLWDLLYYAVPEGLWGASVGKGVCGLRVVGPNRGPAGLPRSLLRSLIYRTTWTVPILITLLVFTGAEYQARITAGQWSPEDWFWFPMIALLFCTIRRRNGFAALHDLATNTRVIARPAATQRPKLVGCSPLAASYIPGGASLGPYEVLGILGSIGAGDSLSPRGGEGQGEGAVRGELLLAHDPALRRNLWIHQQSPGAPPVSVRRRDLSRATRLRWLNGERTNEVSWDAYEALDGAPLVKLPPQNWAAVRFWLHDLATDFAVGSNHDSLPPALQLDHVWITAANRAVLLDFPAVGLPPTSVEKLLEARGSSRQVSSPDSFTSAQQFLSAVAEHGLHNTNPEPLTPAHYPLSGARAIAPTTSYVPEPLHAQPFLRRLADGRFESPEILVGNLQSLHGKFAEVSRRRRSAVIGLALGPAMFIAVIISAALWLGNKRTSRNWPTEYPGSTELRAELRAYETFGGHSFKPAKTFEDWLEDQDPGKETRRALRLHMAGHHREVIANSNFWAYPVVAQALSADMRKVAEEAITDNPTVSAKKLEEANATVKYLHFVIQAADTELPQWVALGVFWAFVIFAALLDLGCVLILGEGLFLRLLGIATVNRNGNKASRLRVLWRTIVAWSPCVVGAILSLTLWMTLAPGLHVSLLATVAPGIFSLVVVAAIALAIWKPARGVQDLAANTWLVPQ